MKRVVFVAPYFLPTTVRFIASVTNLPQVKVALISCDHIDRLGAALKGKLTTWERVANGLDAGQLAVATRKCAQKLGGVDHLFGALEDLQVPLGKVRDYLKIPGMSAQTAQNFRDKGRMKDVLRNGGVPCARHRRITEVSQAWAFVEEVGFPLVVKPPAGAGARGTFQVKDAEQLTDYLAVYAPTPQQPALLEEFIVGDEYSFETVSIGGQPVWHSLSRYYPSPLEVLKNPWIQWCVLLPREVDHPHFEDIVKVNGQTLGALGMGTGLTHMEWFRRKDGSVAVSEVGARPPGAQFMSLISYAHDIDFYAAWARLMVFGEFKPPTREYAAGAAYLRGMGHGRIKAIHGLEQAQKEVGEVVIEASLPKIGQVRASTYEGEGYVIVRHRETEVVKRALTRLISLIRVEYTNTK